MKSLFRPRDYIIGGAQRAGTMPKRYRWTFVNGGRAQLVDLAGAIGVPQRSQKWCNILLKEKFFLFAINENLGWLYVLAINTARSSSHFRRSLKEARHSTWPLLHQRKQNACLRLAMQALPNRASSAGPIAAVDAPLIGRSSFRRTSASSEQEQHHRAEAQAVHPLGDVRGRASRCA